jgi:hypothetical protein
MSCGAEDNLQTVRVNISAHTQEGNLRQEDCVGL